jgi:hypothetical protein
MMPGNPCPTCEERASHMFNGECYRCAHHRLYAEVERLKRMLKHMIAAGPSNPEREGDGS